VKKILSTSITAVAALAVLAGCSATSEAPKKSETPKPSSTASAAANNVCKDGVLTVTDAASAKKALKQGCDTVYLLTSNVDLDLGDVQKLGIEGNGNTVSVASMSSIYVMGKDNTVTFGGKTPDTKGVAEGNSVTAK
jgi:hypothetical protein